MSLETLRGFALNLPHAEEGTSCSNVAFKAGAKNFSFMGTKDDALILRFKLVEKVAVAARFPGKRFQAWMAESYRVLVPKKLQQNG